MSVLVAGNVLTMVAKQVWPWSSRPEVKLKRLRALNTSGTVYKTTVGPFLGQRSLQGGRLPWEGGSLQNLPPSHPAPDRANPSHSAILKFVESFSTTK